ncbi:hypothetical protein ACFL35_08835 [Candidatus Riflebacteria bacterium]
MSFEFTEPPAEFFSSEKPLKIPRRYREKKDEASLARQGLTLNGLSGLVYTETTEKLERHRLLFGSYYSYTPWSTRYDHSFSKSETGALQTWQISAMYPTDTGEIAVTIPYHYYDLSAPRLFGLPAHQHTGLGDAKIAGKLSWYPRKRYYQFGCGVVVDFPTGEKRSLRAAGVTGQESIKLYGNVSTEETRDLRGHVQLGYIFKEDGFDVYFYNIAADYKLAKQSSLLVEFVGSEGPDGYGSNLDFVPSVRVAISEAFSGTLSTPFNLYNDREFGYDYRIILGSMYRW